MAEVTQLPSRFESRAAAVFNALQEELDPDHVYGGKQFAASLKTLGLEPDDLDPEGVTRGISVHSRVPDHRAPALKQQRSEVWEGLRQQRLHEVTRIMESQSDSDIRRFMKTGGGIRPVTKHDLPPVDGLEGMGDFNALMAEKNAKNKAEQQRKANKLAGDFLREKKRMEEADAKLAAMEQRMQEYKKAQKELWKAKKLESDKKTERRAAAAKRAADERSAYEDEVEAKANERLQKARTERAKKLSKETLKDKMAAAEYKRTYAFHQAIALEAQMTQSLEEKREALEDRLENRRIEVEDERAEKASASAAKFQERQIRVHAHFQDWAEKKLDSHNTFMDHFQQSRQAGKDFCKQRSKETFDTRKKARDKWKSNFERLAKEKDEADGDLMARHEHARKHCEWLAEMKMKCDNDVFSFREYKEGTWGELVRKRQSEYKKARDAKTQALLIKIAEVNAVGEAKTEGQRELERRKQCITRELLVQKDLSEEGFRKIQCEGDERKIIEVMTSLGFDMPKLPDPEDGEMGEGGESKPAF
eukprot:TRINITY_DN9110_c0_g1_i1.p1 TRINITY_DN9110_c0_g1~~TRINITY_DN9110_c0_g1_i1.p1  ORF type:complete len:533 (-),score=160.85 TRINITY_DN9110_c0_g1_i1:92-1690(-)